MTSAPNQCNTIEAITMTLEEIDRLRPFGSVKQFRNGDALTNGRTGPGIVLISGHATIAQRDGIGGTSMIATRGPGQFLAEAPQIFGRTATLDVRAVGDVEALMIESDALRRVFVADAELGERIMQAMILLRVPGALILIGTPLTREMVDLQVFLSRNGFSHQTLQADSDKAADLMQQHSIRETDLPLVICQDGSILRRPTIDELAIALGMRAAALGDKEYDVAIVGAGPAGLAAAIYAASEGLGVAVIDAKTYGGQAGASARIENYLGFPAGVSGQDLAQRAFLQAQKFGVDMLIPAEATTVDCDREANGGFVKLGVGDHALKARTLVIASGATYRKPPIKNLAAFEGRGVYYWASPVEAKLCAGQEVILIGGGNSAGQAAVYLSRHAAKVNIMIRGQSLTSSMSNYLIERIASTKNIEVICGATVLSLEERSDGAGLGLVKWKWEGQNGPTLQQSQISHVFVFVGADPATKWLNGCGVALDDHGFVVTGQFLGNEQLETSRPGVFSIGDVRCGSVKRVGSAIGEGAQVVQAIHGFIADQ